MKFKILSIVSMIALVSCSSANKISGDDGWVDLFDGETTNGWHTYGKEEAGAAWEVVDGSLYLNVEGKSKEDRGDLVTDKEYENYHLKLEWKISEGGNSGIIFNVHEDKDKYGATYSTGPEMQVLDNDKHADGKIHKHRTGDLYDLIASSSEPMKPVGEWNQAEIISNQGELEFILNGVSVVKTTMWDDSWKELIAGSKFADWPGFGTYRKGKIALQDHNDPVWYRNIKIKEL
ncbi:3-keto-disaccharide hydrolase [Albibacterium indicum]|uniref:3-keto-disaccharide hydrolase n=1 Tax=Albibacterium indicum TaxID=2292082 RepID=UPI000E5471BC|nr:DUF1080 domain-containing protein [Pedobacter indicus]